MRRWLVVLAMLVWSGAALAQGFGIQSRYAAGIQACLAGAPSGACNACALYEDRTTGIIYACSAAGSWVAAGGSGSGITGITGDSGGTTTGSTVTLAGGAGITTSRATDTVTIATASTEAGFLTAGALTCGAGTAGKAEVHTTPLQYCDNAATPALQYAAYGRSTGVPTLGVPLPMEAEERVMWWWPASAGTGAIAFLGTGATSMTSNGTASGAPTLVTNRMYLSFLSGSTTNSDAGVQSAAALARSDWFPKYSAIVRTDASIAVSRFYHAVFITDELGITVPTVGTPVNSAEKWFGIGYEAGINSNHFVCVSSDGGNTGANLSAIEIDSLAVLTNTEYLLTIEQPTLASVVCCVNTTCVSKSTNMPGTGAGSWFVETKLRTLENSPKTFNVAKAQLRVSK